MKKNIIITLVLILLANIPILANNTYLISSMQKNTKSEFISNNDAYEALVLAINLSKQYKSIAKNTIDSIIENTPKIQSKLNISEMAEITGADNIIFPGISVLNNLIRVELVVKSNDTNMNNKKSIGFSLINYRDIETNKGVYVPALISAFQRAFASLVGDTNLYDSYRNAYRVYPAKTLVICGLEFIDNDSLDKWYLFEEKQLMSYDMIETIFEFATYHPKYVTYDTQSRDTLYSFFNIYETSNSTTPSETELLALQQIGADYFISGSIERVNKGIEISLSLFELKEKTYHKINTVSNIIEVDKLSNIRFSMRMTALELLFGKIDADKKKILQERLKLEEKEEKN